MSISQILDHDEEVRRRRNFVTFDGLDGTSWRHTGKNALGKSTGSVEFVKPAMTGYALDA